MKKIFYILVFFIIAGIIFYIADNLNAQNGVTIGELSQLVNGNKKVSEGEIEKGLSDVKNDNMLEEKNFSPFISIGKSLQGEAKKMYDSIVVSNYKRDNLKFLKMASNLKPEEITKLYNILKNNNIDKSSIISSIQESIKDKNLTKEQGDKLANLIN